MRDTLVKSGRKDIFFSWSDNKSERGRDPCLFVSIDVLSGSWIFGPSFYALFKTFYIFFSPVMMTGSAVTFVVHFGELDDEGWIGETTGKRVMYGFTIYFNPCYHTYYPSHTVIWQPAGRRYSNHLDSSKKLPGYYVQRFIWYILWNHGHNPHGFNSNCS